MAKPVSVKKGAKNVPKAAAANTAKKPAAVSAKDNPSKYAPGKDTDLSMQSIDMGEGLVKLFTGSLKDIYWAENQLVKALPKMANAAASKELAKALRDHLAQTKTHVKRLEQAFDLLGKKAQAKKCDAMEGLTKEGEGIIEETTTGTPARDLGIIMASQKVEHYEISAYTGLINLATYLELTEIAEILSSTLAEENDSEQLLTKIAAGILS
jgi:ferritin-like metal-binding protein YciE